MHKKLMRKIIWFLTSVTSVGIVSAQMMQDFTLPIGDLIESLGPSMNRLADALFAGSSFSGSDWLNIVAFWILISVLMHSFLARFTFFNNSKASSMTLSIIAGYFLLNNPVSMNLLSQVSDIASLAVIFFSIGVLWWILPKLTISTATKQKLDGSKENKDEKKQRQRLELDEKINQMQQHLLQQEKQLEQKEDEIEKKEEESDSEALRRLGELLSTLRIAESFEKTMKEAEKLAKKVKDPLKLEAIQNRYKQYEERIKPLLQRISGIAKTIELNLHQEEVLDKTEEQILDIEKKDIKKEYKEEKKEKKDLKKSAKEEEKGSKNKYLPETKRSELRMWAVDKRAALNFATKKMELIARKKKIQATKYKEEKMFDWKKTDKQLKRIEDPTVNMNDKISNTEKLIKKVEQKRESSRRIQQLNKDLESIDKSLQTLEQQQEGVEKKEESEMLKAA